MHKLDSNNTTKLNVTRTSQRLKKSLYKDSPLNR